MKSAGEWNERAIARLLTDLQHLFNQADLPEADEQALPWLVQAALKGEDIAERYPEIYQKMLAHPELYAAFVDALRTLEEESEKAPDVQPEEAGTESDWLTLLVKPEIEQPAGGPAGGPAGEPGQGWRLIWQQKINQLQAIFFPPTPDVVFRAEANLWEDISLPILWGRGELTGGSVQVFLQAVQKVDAPELLYPQAWLTFEQDPEAAGRQPVTGRDELQLRLQWGVYDVSASVNAQGQAAFPPVVLQAVLDELGEKVIADLALSLKIPGQ